MGVRAFVALCFAGSLSAVFAAAPHPAKQSPPNLMLWSWFADDDFRPFADRPIGVAYLALSLQFQGQSTVLPDPRSVPVRISPKTYQMAVVRFDYQPDTTHRPAFSATQRTLAVKMIGEIVRFTKPQAVQIDFDAPRSAWPFYRQLLTDLRARLGPNIFLSSTALVSWCQTANSWLAALPVDEIVPMAFSIGQATAATFTMLEHGGQFAFPGCRTSIGLEMDPGYEVPPGHGYELPVKPRKKQRAYFFLARQPWSADLLSRAEKAVLP